MGVPSDAAVSRGDIMRELSDIRRQLQRLTTARRGEHTAIGAGGIRVHSGGSVTVEDGGSIQARGPLGGTYALFGPVVLSDTGDESGRGLLIQRDGAEPAERPDILRALERPTGQTVVIVGQEDEPVDQLRSTATATVLRGEQQHMVPTEFASIAPSNLLLLAPEDSLVGMRVTDTTGSANMIIEPDFGPGVASQVQRVTSAAAAKVDTEDIGWSTEAVLSLRPRIWRDRAEVERDPQTDRWHVGLVAEEVEQAGLAEFVDYDAGGAPRSVAYDRLAVALIGVLREMRERLDALDGGPPARATASEPARKPKRRARPAGLRMPTPPSPDQSATAPDRTPPLWVPEPGRSIPNRPRR